MKTSTLKLALALAALPVLALPAAAETAFIAAQGDSQYLAKDHLIGAKVYGKEGKIIADVEDLLINDQNQVVGVVLGTGGYLGFAEKKIAVELSSLKFEDKGGKIAVELPDATKETIDKAPAFTRKQPAKSLLEKAREKVNELTDKTTTSTEGVLEKAKPAYDEAKRKAGEAIEKAKEAAAPMIEETKKAVSGAIDSAKETVAPATPAPAPAAPAAP